MKFVFINSSFRLIRTRVCFCYTDSHGQGRILMQSKLIASHSCMTLYLKIERHSPTRSRFIDGLLILIALYSVIPKSFL